ncbi:MAG: hypothetical protein O3C43_23450 [Verrucomicrobia bacterium]|nr:hypothetical protein [Verrucomicrobiota bacterium]
MKLLSAQPRENGLIHHLGYGLLNISLVDRALEVPFLLTGSLSGGVPLNLLLHRH